MKYDRDHTSYTSTTGTETKIKDTTDIQLCSIVNWLMYEQKDNKFNESNIDEKLEFLISEIKYRNFFNFFNNIPLINKRADGTYVIEKAKETLF